MDNRIDTVIPILVCCAVALIEVPDLKLQVDAGEILAVGGAAAPALWARLAGEPGRPPGQVLYKGKDISAWPPAQRRAEGLLALFSGPQVPEGLTLMQLLRLSASGEAFRRLRESASTYAEKLGVDSDWLDIPLSDPRWKPMAARAEWIQAACLRPALIVSAAATDKETSALAQALANEGAALILTGPGSVFPRARRCQLP